MGLIVAGVHQASSSGVRATTGSGRTSIGHAVLKAQVSSRNTAVLSNAAWILLLETSLDCLERTAPTLTAPWSLAWSILALAAHRRPVALFRRALLTFPDLVYVEDTSTLALACLALDHEHALVNLGVTP